MSDTATATEEIPPAVKEELKKIATTTKRGFDLQARMQNRGLRRGTITLYLDEEKGPELGWARDIRDALGNKLGRERVGVIGALDAAQENLQAAKDERIAAIRKHEALVAEGEVLGTEKADPPIEPNTAAMDGAIAELEASIPELEAQRDELIAELTKSAIVINIRAVPPVIQKDCHRLAKQTLKIETKGVPDDLTDEFRIANDAHLMSKMFQSITDNETGETNTEVTYDDAVTLMGWLPPGQFARLDEMVGKIQFTDAISREIEGQEDFS